MHGRLVTLRSIESTDQAFLTKLANDPVVRGNVVGWEWPRSVAHQERWFAEATGEATQRWIIETDGEPVGMTGLWEINWHDRNAVSGLKLLSGNQGRGLGTDVIKTVMAFAFYDVGLERLHATILGDNAPSLAAYVEKCNWTVEGVARRHVWRHGSFVDLCHVGVLREEFDQLPDAHFYREQAIRRS